MFQTELESVDQSTSLSQSLCETNSLSREGDKTKKSKIAIVSFIAFDHIHKLDMFANALLDLSTFANVLLDLSVRN